MENQSPTRLSIDKTDRAVRVDECRKLRLVKPTIMFVN